MAPRFLSLFTKLALTLVALSVLLSLALATVLEASHKAFHLELHQQLFRALANQLLSETTTAGGEPDVERLFARVRQLDITSPGLAAYIVSPAGVVSKASRPSEELRRRSIAVQPIRQFIQGPARWPLMGDDPLSETRRTIFSAAPAGTRGEFLYVILDSSADGERKQLFPAERAYSTRDALWLTLGNVVAALFAALAAVWFITKPITRLRKAMDSFSSSSFEGPWQRLHERKLLRDEIDQLAEIFDAMAARIAAQIDSLRRADQVRRELFANISHDLRTPLTAVHGYAERLIAKKNLPEAERAKYLEIIRRHAAELASLVDQIMEIAKLDAPEMRPNLAQVRVDELVYEVVSELQPLAEEKDLKVKTACADLSMRGDADLIRRALHNLLDNAFRESPAGESVEISLSALADRSLEIAISDRGPGIPEEELEQIFRRFYRGRGPDAGSRSGGGLGLPIVRRIAEIHGGSVSVENRTGRGTTFRIIFPPEGR